MAEQEKPLTVQQMIHMLSEDFIEQDMLIEIVFPAYMNSPASTVYITGLTRHVDSLELEWDEFGG